MNYTSATRGHWLVAIGAIVIVGSTMLQWWQIGGGPGELPQRSGVGISDGPVFFLMFLVSVASLLLVTLPFASERPIAIDHPVAYLALFATITIGYFWQLISLAQVQLKPWPVVQTQRLPWPPQRGVGLWLAAVGLVLFARGVFEVFEERRRRLY
jgi:hypothetical protein